ncbi:hypothetical protein [Microcoleus sp. D2_18a_B4]|uniref:hypothetical protein n=1 Tax=Microcoleus sp. D2_18a_B4 TaxID=3055329 RepID=UPI002FD605C1
MMEQIDYNFSKSEKAKGTQKRAPLSATGKMPVPQKINFLVEQASCLFIKG